VEFKSPVKLFCHLTNFGLRRDHDGLVHGPFQLFQAGRDESAVEAIPVDLEKIGELAQEARGWR